MRPLRLALLVWAMAMPAAAQEIVAPATRDVTPAGVMPAPAGEGPLIREPVPPPPPAPARWHRFFLPETTAAATFAVKGMTIHIAGVTPPAVEATCKGGDGKDWPCGRSALFSFRLFLHGRAVECFFPFADGTTEVTAPCRVGKTDLGTWLMTQGWAAPSDMATDAYRSAATEARCARRGQWREKQLPKDCPQP